MDNQNKIQLDEIRERIDIVNLISKYIPVQKSGKNFSARCPFHNEKTPSFMISPDLQRYKCFGCGKSGDIFTFVMDYEHVDFREALEKLAKEAGVKIVTAKKSQGVTIFDILYMINQISAQFFNANLYHPEAKIALEYLYKRGFKDDAIKQFNIGYAIGNNTLLQFLLNKAKFTDEQLLKSGLFTIDERNKKIKDKFNKRIVFPIQNERGKVVAFSGRILPGNDYGPKYLNSPETPIFQKRKNMFALYQARQSIRAEDLAILCEGQTDTISCHMHGVKNIVAPLGTGLTEEQISTIKKYSNNILLLFDSDKAGQSAVERAFMLCARQGINTYANNTGKYKDLDEMIQAEPDLLAEMIKSKQDAFTYLISNMIVGLDLNNYESYIKTMKYIHILLQNVQSQSVKDFYLQSASKITGIPIDTISQYHLDPRELKSFGIYQKDNINSESTNTVNFEKKYGNDRNNKNNSATTLQGSANKISKIRTAEQYLLYYIIKYKLYDFLKKIDIDNLLDPDIIAIISKLKEKYSQLLADKAISTNKEKIDLEIGKTVKNLLSFSDISHDVVSIEQESYNKDDALQNNESNNKDKTSTDQKSSNNKEKNTKLIKQGDNISSLLELVYLTQLPTNEEFKPKTAITETYQSIVNEASKRKIKNLRNLISIEESKPIQDEVLISKLEKEISALSSGK
ncbi:MAG TPA: DNA primase [Candidatus Dojkabacteria bacterium]|nr:DNA primase [Candidatus Dojkabacteria bacterium]